MHEGLEVGKSVRIWVRGMYTGLHGSNMLLEGNGGVSRLHTALVQGSGYRLREEHLLAVDGYVRTIGRRGGVLLTVFRNRGHSASISGKHIERVDAR